MTPSDATGDTLSRRRALRILGIDPGLASTGFAVIDRTGTHLTPVWYDCLRTKPSEGTAERLLRIGRAVREALAHLQPDCVAIEGLFFGASAQAALAVGQARGVCILAAAEAGLDVHEYSPATVKQSVTGHGRAEKEQVQGMVQRILRMDVPPRPDHCADAFAVAICHSGAAGFARV